MQIRIVLVLQLHFRARIKRCSLPHHAAAAPETVKGQAKEFAVRVAFDEHRLQRVKHVVAPADIDDLQSVQSRHDLARPHGQADPAQDARELHDVEGERAGHGPHSIVTPAERSEVLDPLSSEHDEEWTPDRATLRIACPG